MDSKYVYRKENKNFQEEDESDISPRFKTDRKHSFTSSSITNSASNRDTESSVMGITSETATSNSELFSNSTGQMHTTSISDTSPKKLSNSLEYEELLDNSQIRDDKTTNNGMRSSSPLNDDE